MAMLYSVHVVVNLRERDNEGSAVYLSNDRRRLLTHCPERRTDCKGARQRKGSRMSALPVFH